MSTGTPRPKIGVTRAAFLARWHEGAEPSRLYSRHRPRAPEASGRRRSATRSVTERRRYLEKKAQQQAGDSADKPLYNRARRVELPVSDAELARRYYAEHTTLDRLALEYGTTRYTIRRRIKAARTADPRTARRR